MLSFLLPALSLFFPRRRKSFTSSLFLTHSKVLLKNSFLPFHDPRSFPSFSTLSFCCSLQVERRVIAWFHQQKHADDEKRESSLSFVLLSFVEREKKRGGEEEGFGECERGWRERERGNLVRSFLVVVVFKRVPFHSNFSSGLLFFLSFSSLSILGAEKGSVSWLQNLFPPFFPFLVPSFLFLHKVDRTRGEERGIQSLDSIHTRSWNKQKRERTGESKEKNRK